MEALEQSTKLLIGLLANLLLSNMYLLSRRHLLSSIRLIHFQIDLDGTDDDIRDIQQEITLLSTCASSYVTRYKKSFVRGVKLWIVMEYLGGGSCLDLVCIAWFYEGAVAHAFRLKSHLSTRHNAQ